MVRCYGVEKATNIIVLPIQRILGEFTGCHH